MHNIARAPVVMRILFPLALLPAASSGAATNVTFSEHLIRDGYGYAYGVASADLDGDGDQDLTSQDILGNPSMSSLYWLENDGLGTFQMHTIQTNDPGWFERHAIGDINGDGRPDVAIVNNRDGHVVWFANNEAPAAGPWQRFEITTNTPRAYDVVLVDLDNDNDLDAAVAGYAGSDINWYANPGSGGWHQVWNKYLVGAGMPEARTVRAGDFNRDGRTDLFCAAVGVGVPLGAGPSEHGCRVVWYENTGWPINTGPWPAHIIDDAQHYPIHGHPVDLDEDGDLDAVMAQGMRSALVTQDLHRVVWYEDTGSPGTGLAWQMHTIGDLPYAFEAFASDLDRDGDLDVAATAWAKGDRVVWFENPGDPTGAWTPHDVKTNFLAANQVIAAHLNDDAWPDLVATADNGSSHVTGNNEMRWWRNEGGTEPEPPACANSHGFIATQSPTGNPPDAARIYRPDGALVKILPLGYWYQEFDHEGNLFAIHHTADVDGDFPIYRYPYEGGTNWGDAELYALLDPTTNGTPEALCVDTNGDLYVACKFPAARPIGMGVYLMTNSMAEPLLFAAMDDISGHPPKEMRIGPDGKLWMWMEVWGMLRWPVGGDTGGFEFRNSQAAYGGLDFGPDGNVYGCVDNTYPNFGSYTLSGAKIETLFTDPDFDVLKAFYGMSFGPDRNGNGSCDIYIVQYYQYVVVYDGETGAYLGNLVAGHPLKSVSGITFARNVRGGYLLLK